MRGRGSESNLTHPMRHRSAHCRRGRRHERDDETDESDQRASGDHADGAPRQLDWRTARAPARARRSGPEARERAQHRCQDDDHLAEERQYAEADEARARPGDLSPHRLTAARRDDVDVPVAHGGGRRSNRILRPATRWREDQARDQADRRE